MVGIYPPKNWKWWPASRSAQQRLPSGGHRAFGSAVRKGQCLKSASQAHSLGIFYLWESRKSVMHFRTLASQKKEKNNGEQQHLLKQLLLERWVQIGARAWSCVCMERDARLLVSAIPCCTSTFPASFHKLHHHPVSAPFVLRAPCERSQQNNCSKPRLMLSVICHLLSVVK